jgi:hypothetical protein
VSAPSLNIHWFNLSRIEAGRVPSRSGATPFAFAGSLPDGSVTDRQHKIASPIRHVRPHEHQERADSNGWVAPSVAGS